jgi:hypothetical protein
MIRITVFRTSRERYGLEGMEDIDFGADESTPHVLGREGDRGNQKFSGLWSWKFVRGPLGQGLGVGQPLL